MPFFKHGTLRNKFIAILIGAALVPLIFVMIIVITRFQTAQEENASEIATHIGKRASEEINTFITAQFQNVQDIAALYATGNLTDQSDLLERFLFANDSFFDLTVVNASGAEALRKNRILSIVASDFRDRSATPGFEAIQKSDVYLGPVYFNSGRPFFQIGYAVRDVYGTFIGAVFAEVDARVMQNVVIDIASTEDGRAYIVNKEGIVIAHPDISQALAQKDFSSYLAVSNTLQDNHQAAVYTNDVGEEVLGVGLPITIILPGETEPLPIRWSIVTERSTSVAFIAVRQITQFSGIVLGFVFLIAIGLAILFGRRIVKPIEILHNVALRFGEGDLTQRVTVDTNDEIEDLAESFNHMAKNLSTSISALRKDRKVIASIVANLTDGIIEHDAKGTILLVNPVAAQLLGVDAQALQGKNPQEPDIHDVDQYENVQKIFALPYERVPEQHDENTQNQWMPAVNNSEIEVAEAQLKQPDSRSIIVISLPFEIEDSGVSERRYLKIIRDVTRERLISEMKTEFITIAAHQMRTPLSGMKWALGSLISGDQGMVTERQKEIVGKVFESNELLIRLVNDLLDVSRIEQGRFGYDVKKGDVVELMHSVVNNLETLCKKKNITITFDCPDEIIVPFDTEKLTLAFNNVLENAINYTREGGSVTVECKKDAEFVTLTTTDTGIGIPKDQIPKLFTRFYRGDNARLAKPEGTGLGLFLVKNIIVAHGGSVWVESEENVGTTVFMKLPLRKQKFSDNEKITGDAVLTGL